MGGYLSAGVRIYPSLSSFSFDIYTGNASVNVIPGIIRIIDRNQISKVNEGHK